MRNNRLLWWFLSLLLIIGCQKENFEKQDEKIINLTSILSGELQHRTQLRLAFGKAVANALVHPDFREYIKKTSQTDDFKGFNEIVFMLHKDDLISENLTLREAIEAAFDEEIKDLFGEELIDLIMEKDPLLTIKLPDIFYNFDWDSEQLIPMVAVKTPTFIVNAENNYNYYQFYHVSGYSELVAPWKDLPYFCLVVKYSEDYLLWNDISLTNEKEISLFEILPQAKNCWDDIKNRILENSISSVQLPYMKFLKKRDFFYYYQRLCEPGFKGFESCEEDCFRDCPDGEQVTTLLEFVEFQPIYYASNPYKSLIFQEGMHIAFSLSNSDINNIYFKKPLTIIGYRKCEFFNLDYDVDINYETLQSEKFGNIILPEIVFDKYQIQSFPTIKKELNVHLFNNWPIEKDKHLKFSLDVLYYEDEVKRTLIPGDIFGIGWWETNATWSRYSGNTVFNSCEPPNLEKKFGNHASYYLKF